MANTIVVYEDRNQFIEDTTPSDVIIVFEKTADVLETEFHTEISVEIPSVDVIEIVKPSIDVIEVLKEGPQGPPSFPDAPNDGKLYARQNNEWVEIV